MEKDRTESPNFRSGAEERAYLLRRADEHRQMVEKTDIAESRVIHERLEQLYREQVRLLNLVLPD